MKLLQMFYEVEYYDKWIPSICKPKVLKYLTKSKKILYLNFNLPIVQERDILLYSFVNNKLKENKSIQFLCKSADEEEALKCRNIISNSESFIRMDLMNSCFDIKIQNDDKIILSGYISIDPRLKGLNDNFIEVFTLQYVSKMLSNMQNLMELPDNEFEKKIKKNLSRDLCIDFYNFINREIKKYFKLPNFQPEATEEINVKIV
jgi:hypothetical protein